jgi:hypothetical protein
VKRPPEARTLGCGFVHGDFTDADDVPVGLDELFFLLCSVGAAVVVDSWEVVNRIEYESGRSYSRLGLLE